MKLYTKFICPSLVVILIICAFFWGGLGNGNAQTNTASLKNVKAYKTLNFGDNDEAVKSKLTGIVVGGNAGEEVAFGGMNELVWSSLFDTEAEYESAEVQPDYEPFISPPGKHQSLIGYLGEKVGVKMIYSQNSAVIVNCFQLGALLDTNNAIGSGGGDGSLAIVEIDYATYDLSKLVDAFKQNYPNAREEKKDYKIDCETYPGIFFKFERSFLTDVNADQRAKLSIPTQNFTFTFTEPSKLTKDQLAVWEGLMALSSKTNMDDYFEFVKSSILQLSDAMKSAKKLDGYSFTLLGLNGAPGHSSDDYQSIIYGAPSAVFASKQILGLYVNNYQQSIESQDQKEKAELKKESESSTGF